jgi:hypothetical protein
LDASAVSSIGHLAIREKRMISIDTILNQEHAIELERRRLDAQIAYIEILLANLKPEQPQGEQQKEPTNGPL